MVNKTSSKYFSHLNFFFCSYASCTSSFWRVLCSCFIITQSAKACRIIETQNSVATQWQIEDFIPRGRGGGQWDRASLAIASEQPPSMQFLGTRTFGDGLILLVPLVSVTVWTNKTHELLQSEKLRRQWPVNIVLYVLTCGGPPI